MKFARLVLVVFAVTWPHWNGAVGQNFDRGLNAAENGDFATAVAEWSALAEIGHASAQTSLGYLYEFGLGVASDISEAVKLYQAAADQGFADAQFNLAGMYDEGRGIGQNKAEAAKWYQLAGEQGHISAQYNLGLMYKWGEGVAQSYVNAMKWPGRSAGPCIGAGIAWVHVR